MGTQQRATECIRRLGVWAPWAALLIVTALLVVWAEREDPDWALPNAFQIASSVLALACSVRLLRRTTAGALLQRSLLVAGCALWYTGDFIGLSNAALGHDLNGLPALELTYLAAQVTWMVSVLLVAGRILVLSSARRLADGALTGATVAFAIWTLSDGVPSSLERTGYGIATLAVDSVIVASSVVATINVARPTRATYAVLSLSALQLLAADATYMYSGAIGDTVSTWVLDAGWALAAVTRALGYWLLARPVEPPAPVRSASAGPQRALLPAMLAVVGAVVALRPPDDWSAISDALVLLVLAAVVAREVIAAIEQRELTSRAARMTAELVRRAETDELTGLYNRGVFVARLEDAIGRREHGVPFALAYIDLDGFKDVNDTHGHLAGDRVLRAVAERLRCDGVVNGTDGHIAARLGGDEFAVLWTGGADVEHALGTAMQRAFETPIDIGHGTVAVGASIGVTSCGRTVDEVLSLADSASYSQKRARSRRRQDGSAPEWL